jgi:hypothetical protein
MSIRGGAEGLRTSDLSGVPGGFRREVQPRRQHWFLNEKSGFPFRTPAFCSVSRGQSRLGEKEYRAPSVTSGVALRPRTQARHDWLDWDDVARPEVGEWRERSSNRIGDVGGRKVCVVLLGHAGVRVPELGGDHAHRNALHRER